MISYYTNKKAETDCNGGICTVTYETPVIRTFEEVKSYRQNFQVVQEAKFQNIDPEVSVHLSGAGFKKKYS